MSLRLALLAVVVLALSGCPSPDACATNNDCFKGFTCAAGRCVAVAD
ncbi:MAG: hypothetical protein IAE78_33560, partial [Myxococcus sp.]|nr:hypothetical protein [Myxococcus sp.]